MSSALTALQTNSAALRVVSNNVSNLNTPGYARRVVNLETLSANGDISGVDIASVQRVVDQFLNQETLSAGASAARYDTQSTVFDQINAMLGSPGDGTALTARLSDVFSTLGQAALSPTSSSSQLSVLNSFKTLSSSISSLSNSLLGLQQQTDGQVTTAVNTANNLIKQVYDLNQQIKQAYAGGDTSTAVLDERDMALQKLAALIDVHTAAQTDGSVTVTTQDGINLIGGNYAQFSYSPGNSGVYQPISIQAYNPQTDQPTGTPQSLDPHLNGGQIKGLIDMRDSALADLQNELGSFAQGVALSFNEQHNANSAYPPPTTMTGRNTGLLATDAVNFSGKTTVAVTDSNGNLVKRIDVDLGADLYSTDGGASWAAFPSNDIGGMTDALNTALGANGTASFADGELTISATGTNGIVVKDDATTPANCGGFGFSQFFGLNDLFQAAAPSVLSTGLVGTNASGLAPGGKIDLQLKGPSGDVVKTASVTILATDDIDTVIGNLNSAMGGAATFTLNADGSVTTAPSPSFPGYQVQVGSDTTQRGTTGMSFTELFGIGTNQMAKQATSFSVNPAILSAPGRLAFGQADLSASGPIVGSDDSSGLLALQNLESAQQTFTAAGSLRRQATSLGGYAGGVYQDIATRGADVTANKTSQDDRLNEANSRQASLSGVNLDEELSNMMTYQRAYSAGARMLTVVDQLYQTLLQIQ